MSKRIVLCLLLCALCLLAACGEPSETDTSSAASSVESVVSEAESSVAEESSTVEESSAAEESTEAKDVIPPAFVGITDGKLPAVTHEVGEDVLGELTKVTVADNVTAAEKIVVEIADDGGYDASVPGVYTLTISATDEAGNTATATVEITVREAVSEQVFTIGGDIPYVTGRADALSYTTSGTAFRAADKVCVLDKEEFVSQYAQYTADHTNNGGVPYFPNGVIVILDENNTIVQVRIAAGEMLQIDKNGTKNSGLSWNNAIDAANGGGMFKGILSDLDTLIPDGGKLMFVGNPADQLCRTGLIKMLFCSSYESGALTSSQQDVYPIGATVEFA